MLNIKDRLLFAADFLKFKFKQVIRLIKRIPWDKVVSFLNQPAVKSKIESKVTEIVDKNKR